MKVSIIIPAHNEESVIEPTIRAALAQNHPDFEVMVVDNASTDGTRAVALNLGVRVINEPRKGLPNAREAGRLAARGEFIANIDADCLPDPSWLSRGLSHFDDPSVVAVTGPYDYYDGNALFKRSSLITQKCLYQPVSFIFQLPFIRLGAIMIGGNNIIRASSLAKAGGYDTSFGFDGEDARTAKMMSAYGKVAFDPSLIMKTSARRFKKEGFFNITYRYWYHFFKAMFWKRSKAVMH